MTVNVNLLRNFRLKSKTQYVTASLVTSAIIAVVSIVASEVNSGSALTPRFIPTKPTTTVISAQAELSHIIVKFVDNARVRPALTRVGFALESLAGIDISDAQKALRPFISDGKVSRAFNLTIAQLDADRLRREQISSKALADLNGYYEIAITEPREATELIDQLNSLSVVEIAYPVPRPSPASIEVATPDFSADQDYLRPAPMGVDADYAKTFIGGDGSGIKIIDIEGGWRVTHEDLAANPPFYTGGGQINDLSWRNHGTAVMGEIMGVDNGYGITGIAPGVQWGYSSIASQSTANALLNAGAQLDSGDVILIELHAPGPHYGFESRDDQQGYVCMEYWSANFNVIQQLSIDGIIVCEAAGNGSEDFDDVSIYGSLFDTTSRNSQAIICGAGGHPGGADLQRLGFSNYGERVNLQGYGSGVITSGYGGLFIGASEDSWYTNSFSGTSSASPIITGAVAALQGAHKANYGFVLTADEIRTLLVAGGTPQIGDTAKHIGPRPNLLASLDEILGVAFFGDTGFGQAPFPVQFTGFSSKDVSAWIWDFGDGDSAFIQSPQHTYQSGGLFDVTLAVQSTEGDFNATRSQYVAVAADTIIGYGARGTPGAQVKVDVYLANSLPAYQITIPVEWAGVLNLSLDSATSTGLRSAAMNLVLTSINPFTDQAKYTLTATSFTTSAFLAPASGSILSIWFTIDAGVSSGTNPILLDGYGSSLPNVTSVWGSSSPTSESTEVSICPFPGDGDGSGAISIADVTYLIAYIFSNGPTPDPLGLGDANCSGDVTIADVTFLINFIFNAGEPACECAP